MSLLASTSVLPQAGHLGLLASADLMPNYYYFFVYCLFLVWKERKENDEQSIEYLSDVPHKRVEGE